MSRVEGLLPAVDLKNFKDLSNAIFILLKESISEADLEEARELLTDFTNAYSQFYGETNMV